MWTSTVAHSSGHGSPLIQGCIMCYYHHILRSSIQLRSFSLLGGGEFTNTTLKIRGPCSMQWMLAVRTSLVISVGYGSDLFTPLLPMLHRKGKHQMWCGWKSVAQQRAADGWPGGWGWWSGKGGGRQQQWLVTCLKLYWLFFGGCLYFVYTEYYIHFPFRFSNVWNLLVCVNKNFNYKLQFPP